MSEFFEIEEDRSHSGFADLSFGLVDRLIRYPMYDMAMAIEIGTISQNKLGSYTYSISQ